MVVEIRASFRDSFGELSTKRALELSAKKWEKIEDLLHRLEYEVIGSETCAACAKFYSPSCDEDENNCPLGGSSDCCGGKWNKASEAIGKARSAAAAVELHIKTVVEKLPTKKTR